MLTQVKVPPQKGIADLRFVLGPEAQIIGRILDTQGRAVADAVIDFTWNLGDGQAQQGPYQPMAYPLFSPMNPPALRATTSHERNGCCCTTTCYYFQGNLSKTTNL